jgi:hypothetical protein
MPTLGDARGHPSCGVSVTASKRDHEIPAASIPQMAGICHKPISMKRIGEIKKAPDLAGGNNDARNVCLLSASIYFGGTICSHARTESIEQSVR